MIILDYKDRRPLYEQVVDKFADLILKGVLQPDEKMPSVRNLAMELAINPNTIQRAYGELEKKGYIYSVKGRGNFVSDSRELFLEKQEEIRKRLKNDFLEAKGHGLEKRDIFEILTSVYEGGEKDD